MKKCSSCKDDKDLEEFGNNKRSKDGKQRYCKTCQARFDNKYYLNNKESYKKRRINITRKRRNDFEELKKGKVCNKCGDSRHYVLDFHHVDPKTKVNEISNLSFRSLKQAIEESKKCILLCSNCHRELHYLQKRDVG